MAIRLVLVGSTNYRTDRTEAYGAVWRRMEAYGGLHTLMYGFEFDLEIRSLRLGYSAPPYGSVSLINGRIISW